MNWLSNNGDPTTWIMLLQGASAPVQAILIVLLVASLASWAVILTKTWQLVASRKQDARVAAAFFANPSQLPAAPTPLARVLRAGKDARALQFQTELEVARMARGLVVLSATASAAPFFGLLGTVWGIMTSFQAIAQEANAGLAVVAPGIAEALFATALGLFVAIPALLGHQFLSYAVERFGEDLARQAERFAQGARG